MSKGKSNGDIVVMLLKDFGGAGAVAVAVTSRDPQKLLSDAKSKPKHDKKQINEVCAKGNGKPPPATITGKPNRKTKVVESDKKNKKGADPVKAKMKKQITTVNVEVGRTGHNTHRVGVETSFISSWMAYREDGYTHQVVKESNLVVTSSSGRTYQKVSSSSSKTETVTRSKR